MLTPIALGAVWAQEQAAAPKPEPEEEEEIRFESEYVSSGIFRSGTAIVKVWRGLHAEGEYFGGAKYDVGVVGAAWKWRWKALSVSPGFAVGFGSPAQVAPVLTFRWTIDSRRVFSQGFFAQSLRPNAFVEESEDGEEPGEQRFSYTSILDNNHVSLRLGPVEVGPMWERIQYRNEQEWKGGARLGLRLPKGFKLIFQTVGPEVEYRGGIAFEY